MVRRTVTNTMEVMKIGVQGAITVMFHIQKAVFLIILTKKELVNGLGRVQCATIKWIVLEVMITLRSRGSVVQRSTLLICNTLLSHYKQNPKVHLNKSLNYYIAGDDECQACLMNSPVARDDGMIQSTTLVAIQCLVVRLSTTSSLDCP